MLITIELHHILQYDFSTYSDRQIQFDRVFQNRPQYHSNRNVCLSQVNYTARAMQMLTSNSLYSIVLLLFGPAQVYRSVHGVQLSASFSRQMAYRNPIKFYSMICL
jgi:hypothetical protein